MTTIFEHTGPDVLKKMKGRTLMIGLGSMKSGTSWLSEYLTAHPDFLHSPIQEMNYFSRCYDNPFQSYGSEFRLYRMEQIILRSPGRVSKAASERLRALAQLGQMKNHDDFLYYFAERIKRETHFGEISPANSHIPAEGLRDMLTITDNVKFLFLMRDPTDRAASHIQHLRRRRQSDQSIDDLINSIDKSSAIYKRSDYGQTLGYMDEAKLGDAGMTIFYEEMFREDTIRRLCDWLGLRYIKPDFDTRYNAAQGEKASEEQKLSIRKKLEPVYAELARRFGSEAPPQWRW